MIAGLKPYPAYKDSGVEWLGEVPDDWEVRRIKTLLRERVERGRPDEPLLAATQSEGVIPKDKYEQRTVVATGDLSQLKLVRKGDFVISLRSFQGGVEYSRAEGIISPAYTILFPYDKDHHPYLALVLKSSRFIEGLGLFVTGIRQGQNIDYDRLARSLLPVPPPADQAAIVRFLSYIDSRIQRFIAAKERLIQLLEEEKQAIIHRVITRGLDRNAPLKPSGVDWLGDVPAHWEVRRLKWAIRLQRGYDLPADERLPGRFPVISSGGMVGTHAEARARGPGVVIGRYGSTGSVYRVADDFWPHNTSLYVTHFYGNDPDWAFYLLQVIPKAELAAKSAVPGIDRRDLHDILVSVPPVQEQRALLDGLQQQIEGVAGAILVARRQVDLLREYRTRLISDVVTGKLDVREVAENLPDDPDTDAPALDERLEEVAAA